MYIICKNSPNLVTLRRGYLHLSYSFHKNTFYFENSLFCDCTYSMSPRHNIFIILGFRTYFSNIFFDHFSVVLFSFLFFLLYPPSKVKEKSRGYKLILFCLKKNTREKGRLSPWVTSAWPVGALSTLELFWIR
jgi:hypothetical protein